MVTRDMGPNMVKAAMDSNLTTNLKYLFMLIKTLFREVLNLIFAFKLTMVARNMKWLNRGVGVTNISRFMPMFIMNRGYRARFSNCFF